MFKMFKLPFLFGAAAALSTLARRRPAPRAVACHAEAPAGKAEAPA
eukprot:CAMPEP_0206841762 /NCGR_PEP_ID=MMETSP0975-20121206/22617_1 /ASSEMBLY_ACC=CAM_ASM_000399 /TAXON_ID=483370 /ORGANISM="non described non described, Strain CCMP2097" /LENGTH=45 /DNA_ID= /DNA_START= /DNA_END= /DNA_ORIENTATION=